MSDYRYRFVVSIGFSGADHESEYDLIDDLAYAEIELADPDGLEKILRDVLQQEMENVNDSYWEKI